MRPGSCVEEYYIDERRVRELGELDEQSTRAMHDAVIPFCRY
jgi:hypothetical protein